MTALRRGPGLVLCSFVGLLLLAGSVATGRAAAQESADTTSSEARALYVEGDRLYREGRYEEAVDAFRRSYELSHRPQLLFNMANAYERLNRLEEAVAALRDYVPEAPSDDRPTLESRIRQLQTRIDSDREAAERAAAEEAAAPATAAAHQPDLMAPGILLGVGGAALVGALVTGILAGSANSQASSECMVIERRTLCPESARGDVDSARTLSLTTDVLWVGGAALAAVGLTWLIVELTSGGSSEATATRATLRLGPASAGFAMSF